MADRGSMDDLLSTDIDENKVTALVGSLESQLAATPVSKDSHSQKTVSGSPSFNNNHIGDNASSSNVSAQPRQQLIVHGTTYNNNTLVTNKLHPQNFANVMSTLKGSNTNSQIIGISSIINSRSPNPNPNPHSANTVDSNDKQMANSSPSIRIVTNNPPKLSNSLPNSGQLQIPISSRPNQYLNSAMSQGITIRPSQTSNSMNINSSGASTAIHNLASIAAEQKPVTLLPNGRSNTHLQNVQNKPGSVIPHHIIVKSDSNHAVKSNANLNVKSDIPMSNSVIHGAASPVVRGSTPIIASGQQHILKGVSGTGSNVITLRTHTPSTQQHVIVRPSIATTLANTSSSLQVVNASSSGTPSTLRPAAVVTQQQIRQGQVRISSNQVRIAQPHSIAPRQPTSSPNTITLPQGALLVRNESGQLVLVSAPQNVLHQTPSSNSIVTTIAPTGYRVQNVRPLSTQSSIRPTASGQTIVTIQPSAGQPQPQIRGPTMTSMVQTLPRPAGAVSSAVRPPTVSINQPVTSTLASNTAPTVPIEMNKAMWDNVKKCKNFLSTLIKLAHSQPAETVKNVQALIQGLINGKVEPEDFTEQLQHELQSSPQPYLVPFLKRSLPLLRQSMLDGKMTIDGIHPPPTSSLPSAPSQPVVQPQASPVVTTQKVITATGTLTQRPVMTSLQHRPQKLPPSPGPSSSKVAALRPPVAQMAITPGGNKVMVHHPPHPRLPQPPRPTKPFTPQAARSKAPAPSIASPIVRPPISSLSSSPIIKSEPPSPSVPGHREKRKFESLKDGDDDINDVATMGGVNLSEESKNILATTNADSIGAQVRSCKEEPFLSSTPLSRKIQAIAKKYGLEEIGPQVVNLISHATQERLRDVTTQLSTIAEHRVDIYKMDTRYEVGSETKCQLKFMEELDKIEKKRHEEMEREKLLRVIKSRSKNEDPEQLKLKQKAKELQQAEAEELRQKEANLTALAAIGPRKKRKLDLSDPSKSESSSNLLANSASSSRPSMMRPRIKRVNMRDVQFLMENDRTLRKSNVLFKTFLK